MLIIFCLYFLPFQNILCQKMPHLPTDEASKIAETGVEIESVEGNNGVVCGEECQIENILTGSGQVRSSGAESTNMRMMRAGGVGDDIADPANEHDKQALDYTKIENDEKTDHLVNGAQQSLSFFNDNFNIGNMIPGLGLVKTYIGSFWGELQAKVIECVNSASTNTGESSATLDEMAAVNVTNKLEKWCLHVANYIGNLKCIEQQCNGFSADWHEDMQRIREIFADLSSVPGFPDMANDYQTFKSVVKEVVDILASKIGHRMYLVKSGVLLAMDKRNDCENIHVDPYKVFPELRATTNVLTEAENTDHEEEAQDYAGETWQELTSFRLSRVHASERDLNYWREDDGLHVFHNAWHAQNAGRSSTRRRFERFWYVHTHILKRYMIERRVAGMANLTPVNYTSGTFRSYYNTRIGNRSWRRQWWLQPSSPYCNLQEQRLANKENEILSNIRERRYRSLEEFGRMLEEGTGDGLHYHVAGHIDSSSQCVENPSRALHQPGRQRLFGVMAYPTVSARDPIFYRWHLQVDILFQRYLDFLPPYSETELASNVAGLTIKDVNMKSCGNDNQVETFFERYGNGFFRLNHQAYTINIRISNPQGERGTRVVFRVFLLLDEPNLRSFFHPVELDKFTHILTGAQDEVVIRTDKQSSLGAKGNVDTCGFPTNLILPKGTFEGTKFRLVVFVHRATSTNVNVGMRNTYSQVLCGSHQRDRLVEDRHMNGFPFSRRWPSWEGLRKVLYNQDQSFGNVAKVITITHTGLGSANCS